MPRILGRLRKIKACGFSENLTTSSVAPGQDLIGFVYNVCGWMANIL